jgi:hypothetical protein
MTTKRIIFFLGILFLGIIGLVIADQIDFTKGRSGASVIGNGIPDPLVDDKDQELSESRTDLSPSKIKPESSSEKLKNYQNIDGIRTRN